MSQNIFEEASKQAIRFSTPKGDLTTEQLWALPLQTVRAGQLDLDSIARAHNTALRAQDEDSFVQKRSNPLKAELTLKLDVIKAIIERKQADNAEALRQAAAGTRKAQLLEALNNQQQKKLEGMDEDQIRAELAALDAK